MASDIVLKRFWVCFCLFVRINGENSYVAHFTDDVLTCEGFKNEHIECTGLKLSEMKTEEGFDACGLTGPMKVLQSLDSDHDIYIEIWKMLPCDKEMMWSVRANLCDSIEHTDAPWYGMVEAMKINGCPIQNGTYDIKDLLISLDFIKDALNFEFCGAYNAILKILKGSDPIVCYTCDISIEEED